MSSDHADGAGVRRNRLLRVKNAIFTTKVILFSIAQDIAHLWSSLGALTAITVRVGGTGLSGFGHKKSEKCDDTFSTAVQLM